MKIFAFTNTRRNKLYYLKIYRMNFLRGSSGKNETSHISNEEILKAKKLLPYFQDIGSKLIANRVCMGWLRKRSKGKTKYFQTRWFIMVSARQLKKDCELDEEILPEGKLPTWMELETIYYFDDKEILTESAPKGNIPMKDCLGIVIKDMSKSKDKGFTFKIDMGDRIYHLNADKITEKEQWIQAVEMSIETCKQQKRSKLGGLKKNIALLEKIFSEGGASKLQEKIIEDFLKIQERYPVNDFDNLDEYLRQNEKMSEDLIKTMDACMAVDPPRKDIILEYFPIYHEKTCQLPTIYYENNRKTIQNIEIIKLLNWLYSYSTPLKMYGVKDERLTASIRTLSNLLTKKMLKTGTKMVFNILIDLRDSSLPAITDSMKQTNGPLDLFKILNETFESYKRCQFKEVAEKLLTVIKREIFYYQNYLAILLKDIKFDVEKYIGFSNDTLAYVKNTNDFAANARQMTNLEEADIEELLAREEINKKFLRIGDIAFEKLVDASFLNLSDFFKANFMELNMDDVLSNIISHLSDIYKSLHPSYMRKVWKLCLDKVIILYIQCLLNSANKLKIKDINKLIDKIISEKDLCKPIFKARGVAGSAIESSDNFIQEIVGFFEASPAFVPLRILDLRKTHGPSFNINTVKALLNLRVDFSSSERSSTLKECKEILLKYREENKNTEQSSSSLFQKIEVVDQGGDEDDDEEKPKQEAIESFEEEKLEDSSPRQKLAEAQKDDNKLGLKTLEGFLEKKSAGFTKAWEKRYFALKNGKLYWYNHERAREALNSLDVKIVKRCEAGKDKQFEIDYEGKVYKLNAPTVEERDRWVQVIKELVEELNTTDPKINETEFFKIISGDSLFYDYESPWKPRPNEVYVLKGQMDPSVLDDIRAVRSKTYSQSPKKLEQKDRRKSIVFEDLGVKLP